MGGVAGGVRNKLTEKVTPEHRLEGREDSNPARI